MEYTRLSTKPSQQGMTLVEMLCAVSIAGLMTAGIASLASTFTRSMATVMNHIEMQRQSRLTLDTISRDIRGASGVSAIATNSITLKLATDLVTYWHNPTEGILTRVVSNSSNTAEQSTVYLDGCESISFDLFQRNPTNATYDLYSPATTNLAKIVRLRWRVSRTMFGVKYYIETVTSARIVIRKTGVLR